MAKRSKNYRNAAQKIADGVLYSPLEAMRLAKETSTTKFDATVEVAFRLGVDPRKAPARPPGSSSSPSVRVRRRLSTPEPTKSAAMS